MMSTNKVPVLCRFGGDLIWESNQVYYKGGKNRIVYVDRAINYLKLLSEVYGICKSNDISSIEYKYPSLDLDSLVSIENDNDVSNMMEAFPQSSEPIQLFVFCVQNLSIPNTIHSNLLQNNDNGDNQALWKELHESNETLAPLSHNTSSNNNDVPKASNELHEMDGLLMKNQEPPCGMVVNEMPKMILALEDGQEFVDANAFHKALREYSIRSHFEYKRTRSGSGHFQAKCINDGCSWRINACKLPDKPTYKIKSLMGNHTCKAANESTMSITTTHRQANRKWIAGLVKDRLLKNLRCTPKDIVDEISREYGIKVSYDKAWRGKELALKEIHSEQSVLEQSVPALKMLFKEIKTTNPGSTAKLSSSSDNSLRLFVAYKGAICSFRQACRPLVMLDRVKIEGKCRGSWLFAMVFDAKNDGFPVSFAFVESNNIVSWKWFCGELAQVLGWIPKLTLILSRQEGILEVLTSIFPHASLRYSQGKLLREIWHKYKCSDFRVLFWRATYTKVRSEFDAFMCQIHDKFKEEWDFVKDINPKYWATSHFEEKHYVCDTNELDLMVSWMGKLERWRNLPIASVLVHFHHDMMDTFKERFKNSLNWKTILVPGMEKVIPTVETCSVHFSVSRNAAVFEVRYANGPDVVKVDLEQRTCSCNDWQVHGHPCEHAVAAIRYSGCNVYDYFDVHYTVAKYRDTYSEIIHPLLLHSIILIPRKKRKYEDFDNFAFNLSNEEMDDDFAFNLWNEEMDDDFAFNLSNEEMDDDFAFNLSSDDFIECFYTFF